ncbi:M23/M56 family metallopeptidase [Massilia sp. R2A-15]|uniref:M23/M56 family metallopeptidase n=1 Tax=Massilia sp. R2A-15 TaxID=3064278 RepID=UPI002734574B|nr:M23/M56 family metallopeptidase [Massilia sp. R2A-15]WLI91700.1 M23/M56 family metallopeptidase [Massilia sp. R2A-15]
MSGVDLFALQFLQACLGCVLAAGAAWAILTLACRRWPALAMSRAAWLLAQVLAVAVWLAILAPQRESLSVMPAIEFEAAPVAQARPMPQPVAEAPSDSPVNWLGLAAHAWLAIYVAGAGAAILRLMLAQRALRRLVHGSTRLDTHAAAASLDVFETSLAVSPMLIGALRPVLLLPRHLRDFDAVQQQMIVAHELAHLQRRDPLWMAASIAAQTALWFNPAMRALASRLTWAQELGCDRQVLAGRPQQQHRAYAAALVGQFKLQRTAFSAALAFGGFNGASLSARMLMIREGGAPVVGNAARVAVFAGFGAVLAASIALQPAFAWRLPASPDAPAPVKWRAPLDNLRVSSFYGTVSPLRSSTHHGMDFIAKTGTPVMASADGVVIASTDLDAGGAKYGKTILIAHANGFASFYAHLDRRAVAAGDTVKAGQVIGMSGATGKVTGPHLHFEVRASDQPVNPESVLPALGQNATASALRARPH